MSPAAEFQKIKNPFLREIEIQLHDLCQPVTVLQCRLELAQLSGAPQDLGEAVTGALDDTRRILLSVRDLRERLLLEDARGSL